jgi:hypothetical protein
VSPRSATGRFFTLRHLSAAPDESSSGYDATIQLTHGVHHCRFLPIAAVGGLVCAGIIADGGKQLYLLFHDVHC